VKEGVIPTVRKPASKTAGKVIFDDMWAGLDRLERLHGETERTLNKAIGGVKQHPGLVG
jgi:hypothetical protein